MNFKRSITDNPYSAAAWYLLAAFVIPVEIWLLLKKDHSFSEQMRYWIRHSKWGSALMMFWIWVTVHFIIEPVVRYVAALMREDE